MTHTTHLTYFERVRNAVKNALECTTSDAQSIIEAYAMTQYGHRQNGIADAVEWTMDDAEDEGIDPGQFAQGIIAKQSQP